MVIANVNRQNNADCISYNFNLGLESFVGKKLDGQKLSIFDIHVKQNISVINETKQDEMSLNWKFCTKKNFVQYHELLLYSLTKFAQIWSIFNGMNENYQN